MSMSGVATWAFPGALGLLLAMGGTAAAEPGDLEDTHLYILPRVGAPCAAPGSICFTAGADSTVKVESAPVTALRRGVPVVPRFKRGQPKADSSVPWTLGLSATLEHPALKGNTLFLVYDREDPHAIANREVTVLFQARVRAGRSLAARLALSPDDGVYPDHTYRIRIVQLVGGKEVLLAEGDVAFM